MEQNKVLMIIVSVAIFFAAVIGVGVALLYPGSGVEIAGTADGSVQEFDPIEYVRRQETAPLVSERDEPMIIVYGDTEPEDPEKDDPEVDDPGLADTPTRDRDVVDDGTADTMIRERPARRTDRDEAAPTTAPQPQRTAEPAPPVREATRRDPEPEPEPAPVQRPAPRQVRVTEYWIQLIASPSRDRVSQAEQTLTDYDLGGRITTRDVEGQVFYRLRVGPYETESEAQQALQWVRSIEGFGEAYISEEYPLRPVNS
jgi:cell division septation protein DedD